MVLKEVAELKAHWDEVFLKKQDQELSWFCEKPLLSLKLLERAGTGPQEPVIDVGAGRSSFLLSLLDLGFQDLTAVDLSEVALNQLKQRAQERGKRIEVVNADVLNLDLDRKFACWHDRALLHFLVGEGQAVRYAQVAAKHVAKGGHAIIAVFAEDGPKQCSNLPVKGYSFAELEELFKGFFEPVCFERELHVTPWGSVQAFSYALLKRI